MNKRPQISILSLILATTIVAIVLSWWRHAVEQQTTVEKLAVENQLLKDELQYLPSGDPQAVVVHPFDNRNPFMRRWRVRLPAGAKWRLCIFSGLVPAQGQNVATATNRRNGHFIQRVELQIASAPGGVLIEAGLFNRDNRGWELQVEAREEVIRRGIAGTRLPPSVADFLEGERKWGSYSESADFPDSGRTELPAATPVTLWRQLWIAADNPPSGHKPGFLVWIEQIPAAHEE